MFYYSSAFIGWMSANSKAFVGAVVHLSDSKLGGWKNATLSTAPSTTPSLNQLPPYVAVNQVSARTNGTTRATCVLPSASVWSKMDRLEPERRRMRRPPTGTIFTWWWMRTGRKSRVYSVLYATRFSSAGTMLVVWLPKYDWTWTLRFIRTKVTSMKLEKEN